MSEDTSPQPQPAPDLTTAPRLRAQQIEVTHFRHIVLLPLLLRKFQDPPPRDDDRLLQPWIDHLLRPIRHDSTGSTRPSPWSDHSAGAVVDTQTQSTRVDPVRSGVSYEQIVYFHPFFRDFLFTDGVSTKETRPTRVLVRNDVTAVAVELGKWQSPGKYLRLTVDRVELHLFKPLVAILVVEVSEPRRVDNLSLNSETQSLPTLAELQDFQDQFRRLYPPFWWDEAGTEPGLCLRNLRWFQGSTPVEFTPDRLLLSSPREKFESFTRRGAEPPLFEHWRWFFGDEIQPLRLQDPDGKPIEDQSPVSNLPPSTSGPPGSIATQFRLQQLFDERMPVMSYFAVRNPHQVTLGDLDRLTFIDASGTDEFPYQSEFLQERRARHSYNRFAHYGTRYFCSGYGFVMLGCNDEKGAFLMHLKDHFRHHYLSMGLIVHYQKAALLYFTDEMSAAIKRLSSLPLKGEFDSVEYRRHIEGIQERFLKFRSRSFFPDVTNQLQGHELFELWFNNLETQKLFDSVDSLCGRLTDVLAERESRRLSDESRRLSELAAHAVPWALGISVFSGLIGIRELFVAAYRFLCRNQPADLDGGFVIILLISALAGVGFHQWLKHFPSARRKQHFPPP